jgi:hypothetical protein
VTQRQRTCQARRYLPEFSEASPDCFLGCYVGTASITRQFNYCAPGRRPENVHRIGEGRRKVGIIKPSNVLLHLRSRIVRSFIRVARAYEVENWYVRSGGVSHLYL